MNLLEPVDASAGAEGLDLRTGDARVELGHDVEVRVVQARTALSPSALEGFDWALNPYRGCTHGCAYCYAPSVLRVERAGWDRRVEVRQNLPAVLMRELRRKEPGVVGVSTVTDPYQPLEGRFRVTRHCLEVLLRHDWPVTVLTKSDLVVRDLDLLKRFSNVEVGFTVTTLDEHQRRLLEPGASPVPRRLAGMRLVSEAGIRTYAFLGPIYPTANIHTVRELVRRVHEAGATTVLVDRLNLKRGVWTSLSSALSADPHLLGLAKRRLFPGPDEGDHYMRVFAAARDEADSLGLEFGLA